MSKSMKKSPHSSDFKFKVALESVKGEKTTAQLCQEYGVVSSQIFAWRKDLLENGSGVFSKGKDDSHLKEERLEKLHATIGKLKVENDFLAKALGRSQ